MSGTCVVKLEDVADNQVTFHTDGHADTVPVQGERHTITLRWSTGVVEVFNGPVATDTPAAKLSMLILPQLPSVALHVETASEYRHTSKELPTVLARFGRIQF